jgi:hypothetical protein
MMFKHLCALTVIAVSLVSPVHARDNSLNFVAEAYYYSESFTLKQILDDLEGGEAPSSGNTAFGKLKLGYEFQAANHTIGLYQRRETLVKHSQGAVDYLYLDKNDFTFPDPGYFDVALAVDDVQFDEYQYRYRWRLNEQLTVTPAFSFIYADDLIKGGLYGNLSSENAFSGQEFSWDAELDYAYREDHLLGRPGVRAPEGHGFTSHIKVDWQADQNLQLSLDIQDILSGIYWQDAPFTKAVSQVNDAIAVSQPAVSGTVGYARLVQRLKPHVMLDAFFQLQTGTWLSVRSESLFGEEFNYIGLKQEGALIDVSVRACLETTALELALGNDYLSMYLLTDSFSKGQAKQARVNVSASLRF